MPRLWLGLGLGLGLGPGCGGDGASKKPPPRSRVNAVVASTDRGPGLEDFCEQLAGPSDAKTFAYPKLAPGPAGPEEIWRWVNVWATWCKPCLEELPMMARWRKRLRDDGVEAELVFLSVDDSAATIDGFREKHAEIPTDGLRIATPDGLGPWLTSLGLDEASVLPVHLFVDPANRLRCVRMGGVSGEDYPLVKKVLSQAG